LGSMPPIPAENLGSTSPVFSCKNVIDIQVTISKRQPRDLWCDPWFVEVPQGGRYRVWFHITLLAIVWSLPKIGYATITLHTH
jgi:hypothetical protein